MSARIGYRIFFGVRRPRPYRRDGMRARPGLLAASTGLGPLSPIVAYLGRELSLWLWRRARARRGTPVMMAPRRASGRAYAFESRRSDANPT